MSDRKLSEELRSIAHKLDSIRIHLVIAHDIHRSKDCRIKYDDHWNSELTSIYIQLIKLANFEEALELGDLRVKEHE